jgi:dihydroflavonol-4-reductase
MQVLVTGGTGFLGSHIVAAVARAGHSVRVLARAPERVRPALEPLRVPDVGVAHGDVTDATSVERALRGCDAVIHAAAVSSLDPRLAPEIRKTTVPGTEIVLKTAVRLGLDPVVHVSSWYALVGVPGAILGPESVPGEPPGSYLRAKAAADRVARRLQDQGAPLVITYPGSCFGPHDPRFGASSEVLRDMLRGRLAVSTTGVLPISDVRDVALLHAAVLEPGRGPRRYASPAHNVTVAELLDSLSRVTGRRLETVTLPPALVLPPAWLAAALQRVLPVRLPLTYQPVYALSLAHRLDDTLTRRAFGLEPRDLDTTMADAVGWMLQRGHISPRLAGRATAVTTAGGHVPFR